MEAAIPIARVHLRSRRALADRFRAYHVHIDDQHVGEIRNDQSRTYEVAPGAHTVRLDIDWAHSRPLAVNVGEGEEAHLECSGRNPMFALYWITLGASNYIQVERVPPPS